MGWTDWGNVYNAYNPNTTSTASATLVTTTTTATATVTVTATSTPSLHSDTGTTVGLAVGIPLGALVVAGVLGLLYWREVRQRRTKGHASPNDKDRSLNLLGGGSSEAPYYRDDMHKQHVNVSNNADPSAPRPYANNAWASPSAGQRGLWSEAPQEHQVVEMPASRRMGELDAGFS